MKTKLPKQWRHWCSLAKLRPSKKRGQSSYCWYYLVGHGRVWRVNDKNMFQCGDTIDDFDRWALCTIVQTPTPTSKTVFINSVKELLTVARSNALEEFDTLTI